MAVSDNTTVPLVPQLPLSEAEIVDHITSSGLRLPGNHSPSFYRPSTPVTPVEADDLIDFLTYSNYLWNRQTNPEISLDRWKRVYGSAAVERMEAKLQDILRSIFLESRTTCAGWNSPLGCGQPVDRCPRCRKQMDHCREHGLWKDKKRFPDFPDGVCEECLTDPVDENAPETIAEIVDRVWQEAGGAE